MVSSTAMGTVYGIEYGALIDVFTACASSVHCHNSNMFRDLRCVKLFRLQCKSSWHDDMQGRLRCDSGKFLKQAGVL